MAVAVLRRKRIIAVLFAVCLVTALFLYKKGVRETLLVNELQESKNSGFSRLDLSDESAETATIPFPTKIYRVIEFEDEEENEETAGGEETKEDEIEKEERENYEEEKMNGNAGRARTDDHTLKTKVGIGERIESNEQRAENGMETLMKKIEDESQAGYELEQRNANGDLEVKSGKKSVDENKQDNRQERKMGGTAKERKDKMRGKSIEDLKATEERKNEPRSFDPKDGSPTRDESRIRDKTRVRDESRMNDKRPNSVDMRDDRKQSNVITALASYARSTTEPIKPMSPTQFVRRGLVLKSPTVKSKPTRQSSIETRRDESRRMEESRTTNKTPKGDKSSVRNESRVKSERVDSAHLHDDRRESNVYTVMSGYVRSTAKPIRSLNPTQSLQRGLVLKSTVASEPTRQARTETLNAKTKANWVTKTTAITPRSSDPRDGSRTRDESRMRDVTRVRKKTRITDERLDSVDVNDDTKQSNVNTVSASYARSTSKPIKVLSPTSKLTRLASTETRSSAKTTILIAKTTKAIWVTKTTPIITPRLEKIRKPSEEAETSPPRVRPSTPSPGTQINSTKEPLACKIPALDPFHPHVLHLQKNVGTDLRKICRSMYPYTPAFKVVNNKLVLKKNVKEDSIVKSSIKLHKIRRLPSDEDFSYKQARNPFNGLSNLYLSNDIGQSDFFRLEYKIDKRWASDLYARVSPRRDVLERQTKLARQFLGKGMPLNVLIIGFDSISRANFIRKLPRVKSFLETKLNTYFMEGMSIVGDATTPILTAMLTGKDLAVLPEGRISYGGEPIDNWPWIMKDYERQGYMTLYAEDDPTVSSFNLRLRGFTKSPTHHYMRPFWLSLESENERDEPGRCSKSESMVNHTLKYVKSFFDVYPKSRKFAFAFLSYLAHAHPNHLSFAEEDLMWFLRTFVDRGYLQDTMLIIMGDHGSRNWEYRDTMQGKLEERLPWFSISLPSDFHRKFAELAANLRNNQDIIASSFDVHATLRHILTYPSTPVGEQTQSLFERLPRNRTCKNAGIAEHWCPCFQWSFADINSEHVQSIAKSAVKLINEKLSKEPLLDKSCHKLSLESVVHAITLQPNIKVQKFHSTDQDGDRSVKFAEKTRDLLRYQIIFKTQPNQAKYEVTGHVSGNQVTRNSDQPDQSNQAEYEHTARASSIRVTLNPEISRLNRYNDQPACIAKQYPYARKFCYCRTSA